MMMGEREFHEWMNLPVSNKHWLLAISLGTIGGCVGWITWKIGLMFKAKREEPDAGSHPVRGQGHETHGGE